MENPQDLTTDESQSYFNDTRQSMQQNHFYGDQTYNDLGIPTVKDHLKCQKIVIIITFVIQFILNVVAIILWYNYWFPELEKIWKSQVPEYSQDRKDWIQRCYNYENILIIECFTIILYFFIQVLLKKKVFQYRCGVILMISAISTNFARARYFSDDFGWNNFNQGDTANLIISVICFSTITYYYFKIKEIYQLNLFFKIGTQKNIKEAYGHYCKLEAQVLLNISFIIINFTSCLFMLHDSSIATIFNNITFWKVYDFITPVLFIVLNLWGLKQAKKELKLGVYIFISLCPLYLLQLLIRAIYKCVKGNKIFHENLKWSQDWNVVVLTIELFYLGLRQNIKTILRAKKCVKSFGSGLKSKWIILNQEIENPEEQELGYMDENFYENQRDSNLKTVINNEELSYIQEENIQMNEKEYKDALKEQIEEEALYLNDTFEIENAFDDY